MPLPVQLPAHVPGKTADDDPSVWVLAIRLRDHSGGPGFILAQPRLVRDFEA